MRLFGSALRVVCELSVKVTVRFRSLSRLVLLSCTLFILSSTARAQIPAGAILWLDASEGVTIGDARVERWADKSGLGHDLVQEGNIIARPVLSPGLNGTASSLRFDGYNYMSAPSIFPAMHDYTIAVVVSVSNFNTASNILSGNAHALWLNNTDRPTVLHENFYAQATSAVPLWHASPSVITVQYSEYTGQAKLYVNGEFADSLYVGSTHDSSLLLGSFAGGYYLQGNIYEVVLWNREISNDERDALDVSLRSKYFISHAERRPQPDQTFTKLPRQMQLYPRGMDDSATVEIAGSLRAPGFQRMEARLYRNGYILTSEVTPLTYVNGAASFAFSPRIHAELAEYSIEIKAIGAYDSILARRDSIACGDVVLIDGQSNAIFGYHDSLYHSEFARTLGVNLSHDVRDTAWTPSIADYWGLGPSVAGWGQRIQRDIIEREHVPVCCINGGTSGTNIQSHERDPDYPLTLTSIYGRMLYRVQQAGLVNAVRFIIWDQGELNYAEGYYESFRKLHDAWHEDYPRLEKIYLLQNRPNFCGWGNIALRDVQRAIQDSLHDVETIATAALPFQDGCHYEDPGQNAKGDRLFGAIERDYYHATDTIALRSPNPRRAYYVSASRIALVFENGPIHVTQDTVVGGVLRRLSDYIYFDSTSVMPAAVATNGDTLFVEINGEPLASHIGYLPDQFYTGTDSIYEGPWIVNERGFGALLVYSFPIEPYKPKSMLPEVAISGTTQLLLRSTGLSVEVPLDCAVPITVEVFSELGVPLGRTRIDGHPGLNTITLPIASTAFQSYYVRVQVRDHNELLRGVTIR